MDNCSNSRANACTKAPILQKSAVHPPPPSDWYRITTDTYSTTNKTQCPPLDHACTLNPKISIPGKYKNIKENNLVNFEY